MLLRHRLEEPTPCGERFVTRTARQLRRCLPDQRPQMRLHPFGVFLDERVDRARKLRTSLLDVVRLEDAGLRLHHFCERPETDALAVGKRAALAPKDELRVLLPAFDRRHQLADEAALA